MIAISEYFKNGINAGSKAKLDVEKILQDYYNCNIKTMKNCKNETQINFFEKNILKVRKVLFLLKILNKNINELVIIHFSFSLKLFIMKKYKNKIAFIHDLEGLRNKDEKMLKKEIMFLKDCKGIICHNNKMKNFLISQGIEKDKIVILELFDYLCDDNGKIKREFSSSKIEIAYVGNLLKSPFVYQLEDKKMNFQLNLYGNGLKKEEDINKKVKFCGKYLPDELPLKINADLGLVWDGNFDESDENEGFKNYTKYNNPHKLSCYIASGIPVVVWKKAAVADFVNKYNVGYTISNIYDINNLDFSDYEEKKKNAEVLSEKVRSGYFTKRAIDEVLNIKSKNEKGFLDE